MNIARRNLMAYSKGHTLVARSFEKALNALQGFFQANNRLTLGVSKDSFIFGTKFFDRNDPVFQGLAKALFDHGIVSLTLIKGLTVAELIDFNHIISQKHDDVYRQGGVAMLLSLANIRNIRVQVIDYGVFQVQEGLAFGDTDHEDFRGSLFWWNCVKGLFEGIVDTLHSSDHALENLEPEEIATMINDRYFDLGPNARDGCDPKSFFGAGSFDFRQLHADQDAITKLTKFIRSLCNDLRKAFIEKFLNSLSETYHFADDILAGLPDEIILNALEYYSNNQIYIPPKIFEILQKLKNASKKKDSEDIAKLFQRFSRDELVEKFRVIFKEDELDRFVPLDYQRALQEAKNADRLLSPETFPTSRARGSIY